MDYLRNCWYMAGWSTELAPNGTLARTLLDEPIVIFRNAQGEPGALVDRCPHRFAPLSLGRVCEGAIQCAYHGLRFDGSGVCVENPHGRVTSGMTARSFPMAEAHRILWIWMGDPELADTGLIRDLWFLGAAPDTAFSSGYIYGHGNYQLFVDNLMDLSHTDYLHPDTLGGGSITRTKAEVTDGEDGRVDVAWHSWNEVPIPLLAKRLPAGARVDAWTELSWSAPGVISLINGAVPTGTPRQGAPNSRNVHIFTPESDAMTHYFFGATRDYDLANAELNEQTRKLRYEIFATEDEPMIRAQQERMNGSDFWAHKPVLLAIDKGAVRVRRKLEALIARERNAFRNEVQEEEFVP